MLFFLLSTSKIWINYVSFNYVSLISLFEINVSLIYVSVSERKVIVVHGMKTEYFNIQL